MSAIPEQPVHNHTLDDAITPEDEALIAEEREKRESSEEPADSFEHQYLALLRRILREGVQSDNRTGIKTRSVLGAMLRADLLHDGFPLLTTKFVPIKQIEQELNGFIQGSTNVDDLGKIWKKWATEDGEIGPMYGAQWRNWPTTTGETIDQLANAVALLHTNPSSRRIKVSAWNPEFLPDESRSPQENVRRGKMALAACHDSFQFLTRLATPQEQEIWRQQQGLFWGTKTIPTRVLNCVFTMRSSDVPIGLPFNIASYALLTMRVASMVNLIPGEVVYMSSDCHIYEDQIEKALEQVERKPGTPPKARLSTRGMLAPIVVDDYQHQGRIDYPVAT